MAEFKFCPQCGRPLAPVQLAGRERLACTAACGYVLWDNPVPVVAGIVELGDVVILVRNREWPETFFGIVTGFLEKKESPQDAILRELKEELNLDGEIVGFVGNYAFFRNNQIILVYHIRARGEITLGDELAAYKLVPPSQLQPWPLGTGPALKDWLDRRNAEMER